MWNQWQTKIKKLCKRDNYKAILSNNYYKWKKKTIYLSANSSTINSSQSLSKTHSAHYSSCVMSHNKLHVFAFIASQQYSHHFSNGAHIREGDIKRKDSGDFYELHSKSNYGTKLQPMESISGPHFTIHHFVPCFLFLLSQGLFHILLPIFPNQLPTHVIWFRPSDDIQGPCWQESKPQPDGDSKEMNLLWNIYKWFRHMLIIIASV